MNANKTLYTSAARFVGLLTLALAVLATTGQAKASIRQTFPWDWHINVQPNIGSPTNPQFGPPIEIWLWGNATIDFKPPTDGAGGTFDLGPNATGFDTLTPAPVPPGAVWTIDTEIVELSLMSMMPVQFPQGMTSVNVRLGTMGRSLGRISNLVSDGDLIRADSFFDIFVEIDLPELGMTLRNLEPVQAGMSFGTQPTNPMDMGPVGARDVRWIPTWIWREGFGRDLWTPGGPHIPPELWDKWISVHGHVTPEPGSFVLAALGGVALGAIGWRRRRSLRR